MNENVITINGTEYDPSDLSEQQKYWTLQIQDLQHQQFLILQYQKGIFNKNVSLYNFK